MNHPELSIHNIHPYAAKFSPRIPCHYLSKYASPGALVLDPFSGCGTTLIEAMVHGCSSVGIDIHPLASLISKVKTTRLNNAMCSEIRDAAVWASDISHQVSAGKKLKYLDICIPDFDNRDHWFVKDAQEDLGAIRSRILGVQSDIARDVLWVAMSCIVLRSSRQDSETRYTAIDRAYLKGSSLQLFSEKALSILKALVEMSEYVDTNVMTRIFNEDIRRKDSSLIPSSVDLVLTSPPYANTYDYYLYHKQRMNWLGMDFRVAKNNEIGSRLEFSSQKAPFEKFISDMQAAFQNIANAMKKGAHCIVVQGDSRVAGKYYSGVQTIKQIAKQVGLSYVSSSSTKLSDTSKMFNPAFAAKDKREHVVILKK